MLLSYKIDYVGYITGICTLPALSWDFSAAHTAAWRSLWGERGHGTLERSCNRSALSEQQLP